MSSGATNHKGADGHTSESQTAGTKQVKVVSQQRQTAVDINKAPPTRLYTRDYAKVMPDADKSDLVRPALGDVLGW